MFRVDNLAIVDDERSLTAIIVSYEPQGFPPLLKRAMEIINPFVNDILCPPPSSENSGSDHAWRKDARGGRAGPKRYALEYDGPWRANVAAVNCYAGGESA
jgi:hypothetical protein